MARPDKTPRSALRPSAGLPPSRRGAARGHAARELADLGGTLQRRARERSRIGLPGGAPCPPFLETAEAEAPGAARLYVSLDGERFDAERAVEVGSYLQLDRAATLAALDALQRAELVRGPVDALATVPPGSVPF